MHGIYDVDVRLSAFRGYLPLHSTDVIYNAKLRATGISALNVAACDE